MAKRMAIFKAVVLALVLVPLVNAMSVEEELAQLRKIVHALEARVDNKVVEFDVRLNDTEELEARVTVLEESVADLETSVVELIDEVDDIESLNILQEERLNTMDVEVNDNINDIEELVETTTALQDSVDALDLRVTDLESGGGGSGPWEACTSSPCNNNATCIDVNVDTFICACTTGYFGITCSDSYADSTFFAYLSSHATSSMDPLIFDNDVINTGGHYNTTTGKYTVPYDGIYQFSVHLQYYISSVYFYLEVDDSTVGSHSDNLAGEVYRSTTILLELVAGQTVHVNVIYGARGTSSTYYSYFSGHLVSPTY